MVIEHGKQELPKFYNPINIFEIFFLLNFKWNNNSYNMRFTFIHSYNHENIFLWY